MTTMEHLAAYLAERDRTRDERVQAIIDRLDGFEKHLATACAVMGWVQGFQSARAGATDVGDFPKLPEVVAACLSFPDLYPVIATLDDGLRPDDPGFMEAFLRHAGHSDDEED